MEERGLRMTKALTSIGVYCNQVYSPVLNTINQDFPRFRALCAPPPDPPGPLMAGPGKGIPGHGCHRSPTDQAIHTYALKIPLDAGRRGGAEPRSGQKQVDNSTGSL